MITLLRMFLTLAILIGGLAAATAGAATGVDALSGAANYRATLDQYCVSCHNKVL